MTTYSSGNIDSTKILVQAILNVTQDISQGSIVQQHIDIDCSNKSSCNSCLTTAKQYKLDEGGDYSGICRMCYCNLENIDMKNIITINTSSFQSSTGSDFQQQVQNSVTQALSKAGGLGSTNKTRRNNIDALNTQSTNIHTAMKSTSFQESIDQLKAFQIISVKNTNTSLINIELDIAINYLSKTIQQSTEIASSLNDFNTAISQVVNESSQSLLYIIVSLIITIVIILTAVIAFVFMFQIVSDDLILYVVS